VPAYLQSELPILARSRHHWIILLRRPHIVLVVALLVLLIAAIIEPWPMAVLFILVLGAFAFLRWQTWRAEWVILTHRRIIRVRGIPETTTAEASLRIDRIAGAILEQTVLGKLLDYGTIELEAPGSHPDVRKLVNIAHPNEFYLQTRKLVFGNDIDLDPVDRPQNHITAPLPKPPVTRKYEGW
jgi:hypothetical protein